MTQQYRVLPPPPALSLSAPWPGLAQTPKPGTASGSPSPCQTEERVQKSLPDAL